MDVAYSVIIPVHNKLPHLDRSISSVLKQTHPNFELIIIDDASTDGSSDKLLEFTDPRIRLLKREKPGPGGYAARNLGIKHASYDWICFLDADDEWELDVLETLTKVKQAANDIEILCWGWYQVKNQTKKIDLYSQKYKKDDLKEFSLIDFFYGPQPMWTGGISIKKELLEKVGGFPEHGFKRGGDMDTWIRCLWQSSKNMRIVRPMTYYYMDSVNMVTKTIDRNIQYSYSDFLLQILESTDDKQLAKAIKYFQNRRIFKILMERVNAGRSIDYSLLSKMNTIPSFYYLALKLHVKKLFIQARLIKTLS